MRLIGITGTLGAGKGTVVEYLMQHHGFSHFSARGVLNDMIRERGLPPGRDTMRDLANSLRKERGPAALIEILFERAVAAGRDAIIESVRTEGEVIALRASDTPFTLLAVDADQRIRYERAFGRGSETDDVTFETFAEQERVEMSSTEPHEQNLSRCMALADVRLENNGTPEEFHAAIEAFIQAQVTGASSSCSAQ
jgi:dephospho-CoA kinase